jgi:hypothetical protein
MRQLHSHTCQFPVRRVPKPSAGPALLSRTLSSKKSKRPMTARTARFATALALGCLFCGSTTADQKIELAATGRDPGVTHWMSFFIIGNPLHPLPIIYLTTQRFKRLGQEYVSVLSSSRYAIVSDYTQQRLRQPDCPGVAPVGDVEFTVQINRHENNTTQMCLLPEAAACKFLDGIVSLAGARWTAKELYSLKLLIAEDRCNIGYSGYGPK